LSKSRVILAIVERGPADPALLAKAVQLARSFAANVQLYFCDAGVPAPGGAMGFTVRATHACAATGGPAP